MKLKRARGNTRKLLLALSRIQDLSGEAKAVYLDDRSSTRAEKLIPLLKQIFDIALEAQGDYEPVNADTSSEIGEGK